MPRHHAMGPPEVVVVWLVGLVSAFAAQPHVVVVLIDDAGTDLVGVYAQDDSAPPTPNLDALAQQGLLFTSAFSEPSCAPTRASLLTGQHPHRHGIGEAGKRDAVPRPEDNLRLEGPSLPRVLDKTHRAVVIGKWHVSRASVLPEHPYLFGFDQFLGTRGNVGSSYRWDRYNALAGESEVVRQWSTSRLVDDALEELWRADEPVFVYLALHDVHGPFERPPAWLHTRTVLDDVPSVLRAEVEAVDSELGRLFSGVPDNTLLVVLSDNGSAREGRVDGAGTGQAKGSATDRGVRVPMIVAGPGVVQGETDAMVHVVDLLPTLAAYVGAETPAEVDGTSFLPVLQGRAGARDAVYVERFGPNGLGEPSHWTRAVRTDRYKLIHTNHRVLMYDLHRDPEETHNLLRRGVSGLSGPAFEAFGNLADRLDGQGSYPPIARR